MTHISVSVPDKLLGDVLAKTNRLGGIITMIQPAEDARTVMGVTIPKAHLSEFREWLHKFSHGLGTLAEEDGHP